MIWKYSLLDDNFWRLLLDDVYVCAPVEIFFWLRAESSSAAEELSAATFWSAAGVEMECKNKKKAKAKAEAPFLVLFLTPVARV